MSTLDQVRALALGLPEATEADHHGIVSFRIRRKIFATVPDDEHVRIMLDENGIRSAVAEFPAVCEEFYWGKRPACVVVAINTATTTLLRELLTDAYRRKAPTELARQLESNVAADHVDRQVSFLQK